MLDGLWQVYTKDGEYLGFCSSTVGGNIILLSEKTQRRIKKKAVEEGDTIHIDEQYSKRALTVKIVRLFSFRDRDPALEYEIIEERESQYKKKKVRMQVNTYLFSKEPG